ncbi:MAG: hypothetical protein GY778_31960 [bacterium]|nr:hypothetical protein [bacterium]
MRHDDGVVVWVNGREVYAHENVRALGTPATSFGVPLKKGRNVVLVKVDQAGGQWGLAVQVRPGPDGAFPNVRVIDGP